LNAETGRTSSSKPLHSRPPIEHRTITQDMLV
jgi:hypothetical protein